ncbi:NAD(P)H-binding protein [Microbacterium oxydans]|uniref:SDR family oxidoreductase n=1 Tax=unclassified Microbacterium TaxID=2609290 RepID=UPI001430E093|nr:MULTISPECIES: NAD(P)H-binding protein [unclassified Microbacterium]MBT2497329.1 NAD(P)H-binding protein [Microbacterium sp. ISL-59]NJI60082.1 NAD(P)H-binding protein [Microbacterium sp. B19(2022)]
MRIAVAGGTGRIGRLVVAELARAGHVAVSLSRGEGIDLLTGVGLRQRLEDVDAVIDATNPPVADIAEAEHAFATITRNLLTAETEAGVGHHVALSIAALDSVAGNPHYFGKRAQEREVTAGAMPFTIVRATQFHDFPAMIAEWTVVDGEGIVPPLLLQPIAPADVAAALVATAVEAPLSASFDIAGPRTEDAVDMARRTLAARGRELPLRAAWRDAALGVEFAGEVLLPAPDARLAPTSFDDWLAAGAL